jgi:RimJ/RimL family protein N-acetyltransferase
MRALGMRTVTVNHDAENLAAGKLYEALGLRDHRRDIRIPQPLLIDHPSAWGPRPRRT